MVGGEVDRRGEESALVADLPDLDTGDAAEVEDEEPDWQPLRNRSRYRRFSTIWNGHVFPLAMSVLPKNSGFQIGEKSPTGM